MSFSELFKKVDAPLVNNRWSWGAVSNSGAVFLRVWQDQIQKINNKTYARITNYQKRDAEKGDHSLGWPERLNHIKLIKNGAQAYCFMCIAEDPTASQRKVADFDSKQCWVGGDLIKRDRDNWLELIDRVKIRALSSDLGKAQ
jgi:hypothetical protein